MSGPVASQAAMDPVWDDVCVSAKPWPCFHSDLRFFPPCLESTRKALQLLKTYEYLCLLQFQEPLRVKMLLQIHFPYGTKYTEKKKFMYICLDSDSFNVSIQTCQKEGWNENQMTAL